MAYQIWDGFDHYTGAAEVWDLVSGTPQYSTSYARFPAATGCVGLGMRTPAGSFCYKRKNLNSNQARVLFTFAVYFERLPSSGYAAFLQLLDNGNAQTSIGVGANGSLALLQGSSQTPLAPSAPGVVTSGVYYLLDIDVTINNATGAVAIYLDTPFGGAALINASGLNTRAGTANNYANQIALGDVYNNVVPFRFDDFHCHDSSGAVPNALLGEGTRIYTKLPSGAGALTNWTPNGAAANYQCVNENPPDDDTTYVSAAAVLEDAYAATAASFTGTVNGVVRRSRTRKDDVSAHTFQNGVRSAGVDQLGAAVNVTSTYAWTDTFSATDPNTAATWTAAAADAAQLIIKEAS